MSKKARKRDIIDVRQAAERARRARPIVVPPTPEQMAHAEYVEMQIYDRSADGGRHMIGKAFRRVARFEGIEGLTLDQILALRAYRKGFDEAEVSEVKSGLDIGAGGGTAGAEGVLSRLEKIAFGKDVVHRMEARVPAALWPTLRAVALHDKDFKALAMERFGSRAVSRMKGDRIVSTMVPRSGTHREIIRQEFLDAARALANGGAAVRDAQVKHAITDAIDPPISVEIDPAYLDERGMMRQWIDIRSIIIARALGLPDPEFPEDQAA